MPLSAAIAEAEKALMAASVRREWLESQAAGCVVGEGENAFLFGVTSQKRALESLPVALEREAQAQARIALLRTSAARIAKAAAGGGLLSRLIGGKRT